MGKFRETVIGAALSAGAVLGATSTDVLAHEAQVNVVNECAGEGNEVTVSLTGFQGHNLLNNVVYVDIISGDGESKGGPAVSDTIEQDSLFTDGTESSSYDLLSGNHLAFIAWVVDYNNDGLVSPGESFNTKLAFTINACEEPTSTISANTSTTTTVPTSLSAPATVASSLPPESTVALTPSPAPITSEAPTNPSNPTTSVVIQSKTPVDSTLPPTGISKESANQQIRIAGCFGAIGVAALLLSRRRTRA